jgi:hypothetical protein
MRSVLMFAAVLALAMPTAAIAQQQPLPSTTPPVSIEPVPGELELSKLIWSTMAAVHHANISGNYSVLRDISSPSFQINNDPARLTQIFGPLRESRLDLANALVLAPTYLEAPAILPGSVLHLRGYFGLRPTAIQFELEYQWVQGSWKLFGVAISPATISPDLPAGQ